MQLCQKYFKSYLPFWYGFLWVPIHSKLFTARSRLLTALGKKPFPNNPWFLRACSTSLENIVRKGEIAPNKQFLLFSHCFLPIRRSLHHFHQVQKCHLQTLSVWKSLEFVIWERVKCNFSCFPIVFSKDLYYRHLFEFVLERAK